MSWKLYEHKVLEKFRELYPNSEVKYNAKIKGLKSGRSRQVDTLIINEFNEVKITTVIDSKCYTKKIDIKSVESFIGFLEDVGADRGIMVSETGYTKSALKRAENDKSNIELKILTFNELPDFIGFKGLMKFGPIDCIFEVPPKWIINSKNPTLDTLAKIYPHKYDWTTAVKSREYIYGTIVPNINKDHQVLPNFTFENFIDNIVQELFNKYKNLEKVEFSRFVKLDDDEVLLLECKMKKFSEFLAVIHYDLYTVIFGLVTPVKTSDSNLKSLGFIVSQLRTIYTTIPGMPNLSEMFLNYDDFNIVKKHDK